MSRPVTAVYKLQSLTREIRQTQQQQPLAKKRQCACMHMAASLGLAHETYSYPPAASLYFPPGAVADNGAVKNFPPAVAMADYCYPELGVPSAHYYSPTPVFNSGAVENEMNLSCGDVDGRLMNRSAGNGRQASRIGFRTRSEVDVLDDGFKWRKYGKKAVKSSPNPRNYYRCSVEGCGVKKRVERDRDDPRYVVTTYDGVHNHAAPGCGGAGAYLSPPPHGASPTMAYSAPSTAAPSGFAAPTDAWGMQQLHAAAAAAHSSESSY